jgi:glycosyltransferase Alg8
MSPREVMQTLDARFAPTTAGFWSRVAATGLLVYLAMMLILFLPTSVFLPASGTFILSIGIIGTWRYSWWAIQAVRALYYRRVRFPEYRAQADALEDKRVDHVYALVTSYKIEPEVTWPVFTSLLTELKQYDAPATVIAAISHESDRDVLMRVVEEVDLPDHIELVTMYQDGTGKRPAMAEALRAISRRMPSENSVCIFMDGDCRLNGGTLEKALPFFKLMPDIGGLTVDNRGITTGGPWTKEWYDVRFSQRHLVMSSLSLSRKLLVLTGRFSVIRARLATSKSFIEQIENDSVYHWRFGRFQFLSGDDKSTWFWLLKNGWNMLYVPDARVDGFEELPGKWLPTSAASLMKRWFGNMMRTNGRAIALGPKRVGGFAWWALIDQRITMWTALVGPLVAIILSIMYDVRILAAYALWVLGTRLILTAVIGGQRGRFPPHWPFLLLFNQILGAIMKNYVAFRMNRQKWTRQEISAGEPSNPTAVRLQRMGSNFVHATALLAFLVGILFYTGFFSVPERTTVRQATASPLAAANDTMWVRNALETLPGNRTLDLPEGSYTLTVGLDSQRPDRAIRGVGVDKTTLTLEPPQGAPERWRQVRCPAQEPPQVCQAGAPERVSLRNLTLRVPRD